MGQRESGENNVSNSPGGFMWIFLHMDPLLYYFVLGLRLRKYVPWNGVSLIKIKIKFIFLLKCESKKEVPRDPCERKIHGMGL